MKNLLVLNSNEEVNLMKNEIEQTISKYVDYKVKLITPSDELFIQDVSPIYFHMNLIKQETGLCEFNVKINLPKNQKLVEIFIIPVVESA